MAAVKSGSGRTKTPDLLTIAFEIIAETGWRGFSFADLAERAGLPMTEVRTAFSGRGALLDALSERRDLF